MAGRPEDDRDVPELAYRCGGSQGFAEKLRTLFPFNPECHGIPGTCCMVSLKFKVNSGSAAHSMVEPEFCREGTSNNPLFSANLTAQR